MEKRIKNGLFYDENLPINNNICSKLEYNIFEGINQIRKNPREFQIIYCKNNFNKIKDNFNNSIELTVIHFLSKISKQDINFPPLQKLQELKILSHEILTYINKTSSIDYNFFTPKNLSLRNRCLPYGHIKGKYFEGIIINSINYMQVITYIMRDEKGRKIIFDSKVKYIGISCDFLKNGEICTVVDIIQDFEPNKIDIYKNIMPKINKNNKNKQLKNNYKNKIEKSADNINIKKINKKYTNIMPQNNFSLTFTSHFNKKKNSNKNKYIEYIEPITSLKSSSKINTEISESSDNEMKRKFSINNINKPSIFCLAGRDKNNVNKNSENINPNSNSISKINLSEVSGRNSRRGSSGHRLSQQEKIKILKQINESIRNTKNRNHKNFYSKTPLQTINNDIVKTLSLTSSKNNNLNDRSCNYSLFRNNIKLENEFNELKLKFQHLKKPIFSSINIDLQYSNALPFISSFNNQEKTKNNITKSSIDVSRNTHKILLDRVEKRKEKTNSLKKNKSFDYYKKSKIYRKCIFNMKKQNITNTNNKIIKIGNKDCVKKSIGIYKHKSPIDRNILSSNLRKGRNRMKNIGSINGEIPAFNASANESFNAEITLDKIIRVPKKIINNNGNFNNSLISMKNYSATTRFNENKNIKFSIRKIRQNNNVK